jgi:1-acyl-sn-glycerol-3-phosphate acyltransferase
MSAITTAPTADAHFLPYPRRQAVRWLLRAGIAAAFRVLADFHINGRENLPESGPLLVVGNHFSFLDPVAVIHIIPYPMEFIGGTRAPNAPRWSDIFRTLWGVVPVVRGGSSRDGLLRAQRLLEQKAVLGIFPEGGSWATVLRPARPGAALLALRTGARVLPIGLTGLTEMFPALAKGRRARVTVNIGRPFGPFRLEPGERASRAALDQIGGEIMRQIAALIPPEERGFYSDDPAVREAARGTEIYPWDGVVEV